MFNEQRPNSNELPLSTCLFVGRSPAPYIAAVTQSLAHSFKYITCLASEPYRNHDNHCALHTLVTTQVGSDLMLCTSTTSEPRGQILVVVKDPARRSPRPTASTPSMCHETHIFHTHPLPGGLTRIYVMCTYADGSRVRDESAYRSTHTRSHCNDMKRLAN